MTNWECLMGTPALAAQFLANVARSCNSGDCRGCPICIAGFESCCTDYRELRDWLEEEME